MAHEHPVGHSHAPEDCGRAFAIGVALNLGFVAVEATFGIGTDSLALDAVPEGIDAATVAAYLAALPGVTETHDLHIWAMRTTKTALTAHLVIPGAGDRDTLLARASAELHERFGIAHPTIQIERDDPAHPCALVSAETT